MARPGSSRGGSAVNLGARKASGGSGGPGRSEPSAPANKTKSQPATSTNLTAKEVGKPKKASGKGPTAAATKSSAKGPPKAFTAGKRTPPTSPKLTAKKAPQSEPRPAKIAGVTKSSAKGPKASVAGQKTPPTLPKSAAKKTAQSEPRPLKSAGKAHAKSPIKSAPALGPAKAGLADKKAPLPATSLRQLARPPVGTLKAATATAAAKTAPSSRHPDVYRVVLPATVPAASGQQQPGHASERSSRPEPDPATDEVPTRTKTAEGIALAALASMGHPSPRTKRRILPIATPKGPVPTADPPLQAPDAEDRLTIYRDRIMTLQADLADTKAAKASAEHAYTAKLTADETSMSVAKQTHAAQLMASTTRLEQAYTAKLTAAENSMSVAKQTHEAQLTASTTSHEFANRQLREKIQAMIQQAAETARQQATRQQATTQKLEESFSAENDGLTAKLQASEKARKDQHNTLNNKIDRLQSQLGAIERDLIDTSKREIVSRESLKDKTNEVDKLQAQLRAQSTAARTSEENAKAALHGTQQHLEAIKSQLEASGRLCEALKIKQLDTESKHADTMRKVDDTKQRELDANTRECATLLTKLDTSAKAKAALLEELDETESRLAKQTGELTSKLAAADAELAKERDGAMSASIQALTEQGEERAKSEAALAVLSAKLRRAEGALAADRAETESQLAKHTGELTSKLAATEAELAKERDGAMSASIQALTEQGEERAKMEAALAALSAKLKQAEGALKAERAEAQEAMARSELEQTKLLERRSTDESQKTTGMQCRIDAAESALATAEARASAAEKLAATAAKQAAARAEAEVEALVARHEAKLQVKTLECSSLSTRMQSLQSKLGQSVVLSAKAREQHDQQTTQLRAQGDKNVAQVKLQHDDEITQLLKEHKRGIAAVHMQSTHEAGEHTGMHKQEIAILEAKLRKVKQQLEDAVDQAAEANAKCTRMESVAVLRASEVDAADAQIATMKERTERKYQKQLSEVAEESMQGKSRVAALELELGRNQELLKATRLKSESFVDDLQRTATKLRGQHAEAEAEVCQLQADLKMARSARPEPGANNDAAGGEAEGSLKEIADAARKELISLEHVLELKSTECKDLRSKVLAMEDKHDGHRESSSRVLSEITRLKTQNEELTGTLESKRVAHEGAVVENAHLKEDLRSLEDDMKLLATDNNVLRDQLDNYRKDLESSGIVDPFNQLRTPGASPSRPFKQSTPLSSSRSKMFG